MAEIVSDKFLKSTTINANNTNGQRPTDLIPDNCHTIVIKNPDATNSVYVAIGAVGSVLDPTGGGDIIPTEVGAGETFTIGMGPVSLRPQSGTTESDQLIYQTSAGTIQVNISYICANEM